MPALQVDESTPDGESICTSTGADWYPGTSYCTGAFANGMFTLSASPFANVTVTYPVTRTAPQGGLSFAAYDVNRNTNSPVLSYIVSAEGTLAMEVEGVIFVDDKSQVVTQNYVFDFDLTAVYN